MPRVIVSRRGRERIRRGHLWVYRGDVDPVDDVDGGEIVEVLSQTGEPLGRAFFSSSSKITLRLITTEDIPIDEAFWRRRLVRALEVRQSLTGSSNSYRWVHGEADGIPSLITDRYRDCLVIQTLSAGTERLKGTFVDLWRELVEPAAIVERNDQKARLLEGLPLTKGILDGDPHRSTVRIREGEIEMDVNLVEGQKTGLFLDQRENRLAAAGYARGRALDLFCYDGAFSLHLARRSGRVTAVDTSGEALARLRTNAQVNRLTNIETIEANAFDELRRRFDGGESFDTIVLDPPAFAKNRSSLPQARRGYKEINLRAMKLLRTGGYLVSSTCSYHLSENEFLSILADAAADARARLILVEKRQQSRDHPILLTMPETYYLKCMILRKL